MGALKRYLTDICEEVVGRFENPPSYSIGAQFIFFEYQKSLQYSECVNVLISEILWRAPDVESAVQLVLNKIKIKSWR